MQGRGTSITVDIGWVQDVYLQRYRTGGNVSKEPAKERYSVVFASNRTLSKDPIAILTNEDVRTVEDAGRIVDVYLDSLRATGIAPEEHDVRFVEDDWESAALGASGVGWEVWLDGTEITQFTYFQQMGGIECRPVAAEITYGTERLAMLLQNVDVIWDLAWAHMPDGRVLRYGEMERDAEEQNCRFNFEEADTEYLFRLFDMHEREAARIADAERVLATVLHRRGLGTHDTLAELFEVSRRTIGGVLREVGPLLDQHGYVATPAATRFTTATELLASLPATHPNDTDTPAS